MSDNENGGGLFSGLLVGLGFAMIVMAPFYIARRLGAHVLVGAMAVFATSLALFSDNLVGMAREVGDCGARCAAEPGAKLILALDAFGWWFFAGVTWVLFALLLLAPAAFRRASDAQPSLGKGAK